MNIDILKSDKNFVILKSNTSGTYYCYSYCKLISIYKNGNFYKTTSEMTPTNGQHLKSFKLFIKDELLKINTKQFEN